MRVTLIHKQHSSLARTAVVRDEYGYRVYLPGPYLLQLHRHHEPHQEAPFPMPPTNEHVRLH